MRSFRVLAVALAAALGLAGSASALTLYTDVVTPYWTYSGIQEASSFGDAEPLFDQPSAAGEQLVFFPPNFVAQSVGGGIDATGSHLQLMIEGNSPGQYITTLNLTEYGDATLTSFPPGGGTAATGTFASLAGYVTVLEVNNVSVAPIVIGFTGIFTPGDTLLLPGDAGTTLWSGTISVDIASVVANATKIQLDLDNDLYAASESNTTAKIQKKVVNGPAVIISVPEPGALAMLALGCLGLGLRGRRS
jgi:hypothetical protein